MLKYFHRDKETSEAFDSVIDGLKKVYRSKLLPLEQAYKFHEFHSPVLDDSDFESKPMVLLVGQYSTGKTSFIRYLLESDFPGIRIGPEPTTDSFIAVMHNEHENVIPGNALVVDPKKNFKPLSKFGNAFLNRFQCSQLDNQVLKSVSFIDTPGILSGEKQRLDRGYDYAAVLEWFAERCDRILLLFDAHKLDISDEFKRSIEVLRRNDEKIRIVLNKADMVDHQQLMRVYGALMWSLGKVLNTPEVARVYIGSFWDRPFNYDTLRRLFELESQDLFRDLQSLPKNAALRKLNDLIKRARLAKVHAYIIAELKDEMPTVFGKDSKKKELIKNLDKIYDKIHRVHNISPGDFPDIHRMRQILDQFDFRQFKSLDKRLVDRVESMLTSDITQLMQMLPKEETRANMESPGGVKGGAFDDSDGPFGIGQTEGVNAGIGEQVWPVERERAEYDALFDDLAPVGGRVSGAAAKAELVKSKLPNSVLAKVWRLSDCDKDGMLDRDEWALANYLIKIKLNGHELPNTLPDHLLPPSKRSLYPTLDASPAVHQDD
ncbi:EH domain-containing 3 isoform X1 [Brachionus plicatilis]|uniref:EH domain-containing 3 isoform X1 n=1 Tax=Brachionus plicatilis TaxID=10195 RepID=A0A3M7Q6C4_BRAPC|nr:EH domain-containing 3 isoform X1 [Brachionus plicatilis]